MFRFRNLLGLLVAGLLVLALSAVFGSSTAGASNKTLTYNCPSSPSAPLPATGISIGAGETFTLTVGANCNMYSFTEQATTYSYLPLTVTLNGSPYDPYFPTVMPGNVIVVTAPASGVSIGSLQVNFPGGYKKFDIASGFPELTGSMADNNDGTFAVTFTGGLRIQPTGHGGRFTLALLGEGSTCSADAASVSSNDLTLISDQGAGWVSPMTVTPYMLANKGSGSAQIFPGNYEACLYSTDGFASANNVELPTILLQSMPVTIGSVPSTTTTTSAEPTTTTTTIGSGSGSGAGSGSGSGAGSGSGSGAGSGSGSGSNGNGAEAGSSSGDAVVPAFTG